MEGLIHRDPETLHTAIGQQFEAGDHANCPVFVVFLNEQQAALAVHASEALLDYLQALIAATRSGAWFVEGLSPRAGIAVLRAAKARALLAGRDYLFGTELTAADVTAFPFLKYALLWTDGDPDRFHEILRDTMPLDGRYPRLEAWILDRVEAGESLPGLYPPNAENKARYEAEKKR